MAPNPPSPKRGPNDVNDDIEAFEQAVRSRLEDFRNRWLGPEETREEAIARKVEPYRKLEQLDKQQYRVATKNMRDDLDRMLEWMDRIDAEETAPLKSK